MKRHIPNSNSSSVTATMQTAKTTGSAWSHCCYFKS